MPTLVTLLDGSVPVAADFNGNYTALNNAIGSSTAIASYTTGDTLYASAANTLSKLTIGKAGQDIGIASGVPAWGKYDAGLIWGLTLSNSAGDATNDIDIAAGVAVSDDATVAARVAMVGAAITKQLDAAWAVGTNAGGLDTGAIANTTYHVFEIMRSDTGVVDALFSTSATAPTMPTNYDKKRRIGSIVRTGGSIKAFKQDGDYFAWTATVLDINSNNPGTAAVTRTLTVPTGINVHVLFDAGITYTTSGSYTYALFSDLAVNDEAPGAPSARCHIESNNANNGLGRVEIRTNTSAQIRSRISLSDAGATLLITTVGWFDSRGRNA